MQPPPPPRLVFMGSDAIAMPVLNVLMRESRSVVIEAVYTQPDRARGRGRQVQPNEVKSWALANAIPVYQPESFGEAEVGELSSLHPDIILVMAYGHLLPQAVLDTPPKGIYNVHTSLLPALRGASPIETAVATGLRESGVSLMELVRKMDAGPVCDQVRVPISAFETGGSYRIKLAEASAGLLKRNLGGMVGGTIQANPQDGETASYCRILVKQDGQLDFAQPAEILAHRINGLFPWPGCAVELNGEKLKVGSAGWLTESSGETPGTVVGSGSEGIRVATGKGILNLLRLQKPGGRMLPTDEFLRGFSIPVGECFSSREMYPLVSRKPVSRKRVFQLYRKP